MSESIASFAESCLPAGIGGRQRAERLEQLRMLLVALGSRLRLGRWLDAPQGADLVSPRALLIARRDDEFLKAVHSSRAAATA